MYINFIFVRIFFLSFLAMVDLAKGEFCKFNQLFNQDWIDSLQPFSPNNYCFDCDISCESCY
jgi:hypothetical protein